MKSVRILIVDVFKNTTSIIERSKLSNDDFNKLKKKYLSDVQCHNLYIVGFEKHLIPGVLSSQGFKKNTTELVSWISWEHIEEKLIEVNTPKDQIQKGDIIKDINDVEYYVTNVDNSNILGISCS